MSSSIYMNGRNQGSPEEHCTATKRSMPFTSPVSGLNALADRYILEINNHNTAFDTDTRSAADCFQGRHFVVSL